MNDETPEPFDTVGDEPVEARIVAWVLGESSAFEGAELERLCEERPELLVFRRRMRTLHGLLTEAEASEADHSWKLPPEKRKALDEIFGDEEPVRLEPDRERSSRWSGRRVLLAIAACVVLSLVVIKLTHPTYESEAVVEVRPSSPAVGFEPAGTSESAKMTPQFFGTEFDKIKSSTVLGKVVDTLSLDDRWKVSKPEAIAKLKKNVETENLKGTDLIAIRVKESTQEDADRITRALATSYRDFRVDVEKRKAEKAMYELNKAVRDQEDKVEERRKVLATIARTKGIIYKGQDSFYGQSGINEDMSASEALQTYNDLETQKMQLESQVNSLQKYDDDELMRYASGLDLPENIVRNLYPKYLETTREINDLKIKGLGEGHPTVQAAEEQAAAMKRQLDEGVDNLRATLQAQVRLADDRLAKVEVRKDKMKEEAIGRGLDAQDYVDAKRDFETDQELLQKMRLAQINKTIEGKMPDESVIIHEMPEVRNSSIDLAGGREIALATPASPAASVPMTLPKKQSAGLKEALDDKARGRMAAAGQVQPTEVDLKSDLSALADSSPMADMPGVPGQMGSGLGVASGKGFGNNDPFAEPASPLPAEVALNESSRTATRSASARASGVRSYSGMEPPAAASAPPPMPTLAGKDATEPSVVEYSDSTGIDGIDPEGFAAIGESNQAKEELGEAIPSLSQLAQREMMRRKDAVSVGEELLLEGRDAYAKGDYQKASDKYIDALDMLPDAPLVFERQTSIKQHLADAKVAQAIENRKVGKYEEAKQLLNDAISADPANEYAKREIGYIDDPIRTNPALTNDHVKNVDDVRRNLYAAEGEFNLGKYDDSRKSYEEVLRKDPYNAAARRGLEKVSQAKSDYYRAAYDQTRAELLADVDTSWELSVPSDEDDKESDAAKGDKASGPVMEKKKVEPAKQPLLIETMDEVAASGDPYSTFSLNISDASFQLAKAALAKGERPDPASIKPEQFYNAVDYGDAAPSTAEPVTATIEQSAHPVIPGRNLVRVALRTASVGRAASQPLRLTLLVDQSGSMVREDRRAAMEHALTQLGGLLTENDVVTIVGFSRKPHLLADRLSGGQGKKLGDIINQAASEGGTNLEEAMKLGGQMAERQQLAGAQNRIVLFTDGAANLGNADPDRLSEQVTSLRQKGIAFDIAGIGADGLNDRLLGDLARHGNGRYYVVGDGKDDSFARQLAGAFRPAAENVKVQVIFNPLRVGTYKLLGFEKDRLKTEDFRNDSVDAAELAADEAGVALYQVETLPEGKGEIGEISVRFRDTASGEMVERSWTIPHEVSAAAFDRATPSMQLAGLSLLAAEKLRGGPLADAINFKEFAEPIGEVRRTYQASPRAGEMLHVIDALK